MNYSRLAWIALGFWALCAVAACPVDPGLSVSIEPMDFVDAQSVPVTVTEVTRAHLATDSFRGSGLVQPGANQRAATPGQQVANAIHAGDAASFRQLVPQDPAERRQMLKDTGALNIALGAGQLAIAKQILVWDPDAPQTMGRVQLDYLPAVTAAGWRSAEAKAKVDGGKPDPSRADFLVLLRIAIDAGANADAYKDAWESPLAIVATLSPSTESTDAAKLLLDHGASALEPRKPGGRTPLDSAAQAGNAELVDLLMSRGSASQSQLDVAIGWTPVEEAKLPVIVRLLEAGANVNLLGTKLAGGQAPAELAAYRATRSGEKELMRRLLKYRIDLAPRPPFATSAIATLLVDPELLDLALQAGGNPNQVDDEGNTPLILATHIRKEANRYVRPDPNLRIRVVGVLLRAGADPSIANKAGITPLMQTLPDETELVARLLAKGGTVRVDPRLLGWTSSRNIPLGEVSWAVLHGSDALGAGLVMKNRGVSPADCGAIYYAAMAGASRTLTALLDANAPRDYEVMEAPGGHLGTSALRQAAYQGHVDVVRILLDRGVARVDEASPMYLGMFGGHGPGMPGIGGGDTALICAAQARHIDVARELIRRGANPDHKGHVGRKALDWVRDSPDYSQWEALLTQPQTPRVSPAFR